MKITALLQGQIIAKSKQRVGQFQLSTKYSMVMGIQNCSVERARPFSKGRSLQRCKNRVRSLKKIFLRTTGPDKLRFSRKPPAIVQVYSNQGPQGFGGATTGKTICANAYIGKIVLCRTRRRISIKLGTNYSCMKRI
jgi:hypothetical protein